jgi:arylsulfatase A
MPFRLYKNICPWKSLVVILTLPLLFYGCTTSKQNTKKPNIVIIYIDDLGYGDVACYGATGVKTPNVDFLAKNGLKFTDAHCTASTCTPSRFSLLTGTYAFRNNAAILPGDAPLLIKTGSETLPAVLQHAGYTTGIVGKWHLGLGIGTINWNTSISPGPLEVGFNYSFIIPATTDRVPCVFVEDHNVVNLDPKDPISVSYKGRIDDEATGFTNPEKLKMKADSQHSNTIVNGISRIGFMSGGQKARWVDEDIADVMTSKAKNFITENKEKPFFLYFAVPDIHVPRAPNKRFVGSTTMGRRGDVITEMDWMTGQLTKTLDSLGLSDNTLIIFTSDNGPILNDGYDDGAEELIGKHKASGDFRGGKYSAFEAGTVVPTITYWPGTIKPGVSDALFSQIDILASLAKLTGQKLIPGTVPDSFNRLDMLLGKTDRGRDWMLEEAFTLSLREGEWKYIAPQEKRTPQWLQNKKIETGLMASPQLYNIKTDQDEKLNVANQHPDIVKRLSKKLDSIKSKSATRKNY